MILDSFGPTEEDVQTLLKFYPRLQALEPHQEEEATAILHEAAEEQWDLFNGMALFSILKESVPSFETLPHFRHPAFYFAMGGIFSPEWDIQKEESEVNPSFLRITQFSFRIEGCLSHPEHLLRRFTHYIRFDLSDQGERALCFIDEINATNCEYEDSYYLFEGEFEEKKQPILDLSKADPGKWDIQMSTSGEVCEALRKAEFFTEEDIGIEPMLTFRVEGELLDGPTKESTFLSAFTAECKISHSGDSRRTKK